MSDPATQKVKDNKPTTEGKDTQAPDATKILKNTPEEVLADQLPPKALGPYEVDTEDLAKEEVKPPVPQWPLWSCQITQLEDNSEIEPEEWFVGSKYQMNCQGDYAERLNQNAQIKFTDEKKTFSLRVLHVKMSDNENLSLIVTGYKAGRFKNEEMTIEDGTNGIKVSPLSWTVNSILEPGKPVKPFGPMGPIYLALPWWYWAFFIAIALTVLVFIFSKVKKYIVRKRIIEKLATHNTALSPYNQYSKEMRLMIRRYTNSPKSKVDTDGERFEVGYLNNLDNTFRLFLVRQLLVPALDWKSKETVKEIKLRHKKIFEKTGVDIRQLLRELDKAKRESEKITYLDCEQMANMSRKVAEDIFQTGRSSK